MKIENPFDHLTTRRGTGCYKWDNVPEDVLPAWVADMDFEVAPAITAALQRRVAHGVFGYERVPDAYYDAIINWFARRHDWHICREHILYTTGVVPALSAVIKALTRPGDGVILLTPVYNCFFSSVRNNDCHVVEVPLVIDGDGLYRVDTEALAVAVAQPRNTMLIMCNPHNPGGRLWTREELLAVGNLCRDAGVTVVSDEIHCELVMPGNRYTPYATIDPQLAHDAVVCCSSSKSFNTAGLQVANIIAEREDYRAAIDRALNINEVCDVNPLGVEALIAAYNDGEQWLDGLNCYIKANYDLLCRHFAEHLPAYGVMPLEGTYLAWIDCRHTGKTSDEITSQLLERGRVQVNSGTMYGAAGEGFIRINMATQRVRMEQILERITPVLSEC